MSIRLSKFDIIRIPFSGLSSAASLPQTRVQASVSSSSMQPVPRSSGIQQSIKQGGPVTRASASMIQGSSGSSKKKQLSENMLKLYQEALLKQTSREELKMKLRKNDKTVLIKYTRKLEMQGVGDENTHEQILDSICEFLITNEGKKMAALSLSESTY